MSPINDIDDALAILATYQDARRGDPADQPRAGDRYRAVQAQRTLDAYAALSRPNAVSYTDDTTGVVVWHRAEPRPSVGDVATMAVCWIGWITVALLYLQLQQQASVWLLLVIAVTGCLYLGVDTTRHVLAWRRYRRARVYRAGPEPSLIRAKHP